MELEEKVSIIVPMYNVEKYICKCIQSLKDQKYSNLEVLLVDDCSTDGTLEKIRELVEKDDRFQYIKRDKNGGLSAARNTGLEYVHGQYISFVDSDDWVSKDFIYDLLMKAKKTDADIVVCDYIMVNDEGIEVRGNTLNNLTDDSSIEEKIAYIRNHVVTKLYKREFWIREKLMFSEDIKRGEDMGVVIPLLTRTDKIEILNEPLYYYYQRKNSLSNNKKREKINLDFYDKAFSNVLKNAKGLYPMEIEYHAIVEKIYGKTMLMIRHRYSNKEIKSHLKEFDEQFPNWRKNIYIKKMVFLKKIFVRVSSIKLIWLLRIMVALNERRKQI